MHLIGVELRLNVDCMGRRDNRELVLVPLDIELPIDYGQASFMTWSFPCTLHTDQGDFALQLVAGQGPQYVDSAGVAHPHPSAYELPNGSGQSAGLFQINTGPAR